MNELETLLYNAYLKLYKNTYPNNLESASGLMASLTSSLWEAYLEIEGLVSALLNKEPLEPIISSWIKRENPQLSDDIVAKLAELTVSTIWYDWLNVADLREYVKNGKHDR